MSLVKAGILEKYDRTSYGATEETRGWFRNAFGGGVNDAAFAYSALAVQSWGESRLEYFKARLTEMWKLRPERFRVDKGKLSSASSGENFPTLARLLCEKLEEASYLCSLMEKSQKKEE